MRRKSKTGIRAFTLGMAYAGTAIPLLAVSLSVHAGTIALQPRHQFHIPSEGLEAALTTFSAESGIHLAELVEDHIKMHLSDPKRDRDRERARGAKHLIDVVHAYLK